MVQIADEQAEFRREINRSFKESDERLTRIEAITEGQSRAIERQEFVTERQEFVTERQAAVAERQAIVAEQQAESVRMLIQMLNQKQA